MKANRFFSFMLAMLCSFAMAVSLVSCGGDDDGPDDKPAAGKAAAVKFTYQVTLSQSYIDLFNVTVTYLDGNGKEQTEEIKNTAWNKTVTNNSVPATFSQKISFSQKTTPDASQKFNFASSYGCTYSVLDSKGNVLSSNYDAVSSSSEGVPADKLERFMKERYYVYVVKADGKLGKME